MAYAFLMMMMFFIIFFVYFIYKLQNPKWFGEFMNDNLTDKDVFTRFVKFLMSE